MAILSKVDFKKFQDLKTISFKKYHITICAKSQQVFFQISPYLFWSSLCGNNWSNTETDQNESKNFKLKPVLNSNNAILIVKNIAVA